MPFVKRLPRLGDCAIDVLGATRKYILPLLEHMDALKITRRMGDERVLGVQP